MKVLYILGAGRTGSTIFGRMLGQFPQACHVGELMNIWLVGFIRNRPCGCGIPFDECPFWKAVVQEAFGHPSNVDPQEMLNLMDSVGRIRNLPYRFAPRGTSRYRDNLARYVNVLGSLYQAIGSVAGARVIVDSSKSPSRGLLLNSVPGLQPYLLHLVRDSRAVAYSWSRERRGPEVVKGWHPYILPKSPVGVALGWNVTNAAAQLTRLSNKRYRRVRYEDFADNPKSVLLQIAEFLEEPPPSLDFFDGSHARLDGDHTVGGNPMRFDHGSVEVRPDVAWKQAMSKGQKFLVTGLTWPLLAYYRYT